MPDDRILTDADVEAIAEALKRKVVTDFYQDLGQGVWAWVRKMLFLGILLLVAYGAAKDIKL